LIFFVIISSNNTDEARPLIQHLTILMHHQSSSQSVLQLPHLTKYYTKAHQHTTLYISQSPPSNNKT